MKHSEWKDKCAWLEKQANQAKAAAGYNDMQPECQVAKRITGSKKANPGAITLKKDKLLLKGVDKLTRWAEHCQEVLNHLGLMTVEEDFENPADHLHIHVGDFTEAEV